MILHIVAMYQEITNDFFRGLIESIRIDYLYKAVKSNTKIRNITLRIFVFNAILYFFSQFILRNPWTSNSPAQMILLLSRLSYPIWIISTAWHLIHYSALIHQLSFDATFRTKFSLESVSFVAAMMIHRVVTYLAIDIMYLIFNPNIYFLLDFFVVVILMMNHGFHCFNNFWHDKKIKLSDGINRCEICWPYYIGYGSIATALYLNRHYLLVNSIYNFYILAILTVPYLTSRSYPKTKPSYPRINLFTFSSLTDRLRTIAKMISDMIIK